MQRPGQRRNILPNLSFKLLKTCNRESDHGHAILSDRLINDYKLNVETMNSLLNRVVLDYKIITIQKDELSKLSKNCPNNYPKPHPQQKKRLKYHMGATPGPDKCKIR